MILHFSFWRTLHTHNGWKWSIWFFFWHFISLWLSTSRYFWLCNFSAKNFCFSMESILVFCLCVCVCVWNYLTGFVIVWQKKNWKMIDRFWWCWKKLFRYNWLWCYDYGSGVYDFTWIFFMQNWNLFFCISIIFFCFVFCFHISNNI